MKKDLLILFLCLSLILPANVFAQTSNDSNGVPPSPPTASARSALPHMGPVVQVLRDLGMKVESTETSDHTFSLSLVDARDDQNRVEIKFSPAVDGSKKLSAELSLKAGSEVVKENISRALEEFCHVLGVKSSAATFAPSAATSVPVQNNFSPQQMAALSDKTAQIFTPVVNSVVTNAKKTHGKLAQLLNPVFSVTTSSTKYLIFNAVSALGSLLLIGGLMYSAYELHYAYYEFGLTFSQVLRFSFEAAINEYGPAVIWALGIGFQRALRNVSAFKETPSFNALLISIVRSPIRFARWIVQLIVGAAEKLVMPGTKNRSGSAAAKTCEGLFDSPIQEGAGL